MPRWVSFAFFGLQGVKKMQLVTPLPSKENQNNKTCNILSPTLCTYCLEVLPYYWMCVRLNSCLENSWSVPFYNLVKGIFTAPKWPKFFCSSKYLLNKKKKQPKTVYHTSLKQYKDQTCHNNNNVSHRLVATSIINRSSLTRQYSQHQHWFSGVYCLLDKLELPGVQKRLLCSGTWQVLNMYHGNILMLQQYDQKQQGSKSSKMCQ